MKSYGRAGAVALCVVIAAAALWAGQSRAVFAQGMGASKLTIDPASLSVAPGAAASAKVTVTLASGKTWGTALQAADSPKGLTVSFNPSSGDPTFVSTMTVHAAASLAPGAYTVKIQATGDDPSAAAAYKVTVTKGAAAKR